MKLFLLYRHISIPGNFNRSELLVKLTLTFFVFYTGFPEVENIILHRRAVVIANVVLFEIATGMVLDMLNYEVGAVIFKDNSLH